MKQNFSYLKESLLEIIFMRKYYGYFFCISIVMTLILFFCFRFVSGFFVYLFLAVAIISLVFAGFFCLEKNKKIQKFDQDDKDFFYLAIGLWVTAGVLLIIVILFIKEINKAVSIIQLSF
jgi:hypothetical protein